MKSKYLLLLGLLLVGNANAEIKGAPYMPELDARLDSLEDQLDANSEAADGSFMAVKHSRATYDVTIDGVSSTTPIGLGIYLPAKAVVTKVMLYSDVQFVDDGIGSLALQCEDGNNLLAQTDITSWAVGSVHLGVPNWATPTVTDGIAAMCEIKAVASNCVNCRLPSAGKIMVDAQYFIKN